MGWDGKKASTNGGVATELHAAQGTTVLSPNGQYTAVTDSSWAEGCGFTWIYDGTTLVNTVPGCARGWLDDSTLLVEEFDPVFLSCPTFGGSFLYDELGVLLGPSMVPEIHEPSSGTFSCLVAATHDAGSQVVSPTALFLREANTVIDTNTGAVLSAQPDGGRPGREPRHGGRRALGVPLRGLRHLRAGALSAAADHRRRGRSLPRLGARPARATPPRGDRSEHQHHSSARLSTARPPGLDSAPAVVAIAAARGAAAAREVPGPVVIADL
jgi:hypothetical protein